MRRDEALRTLQESQDTSRTRFAVKSLVLFGSVARDEVRPDSDVDLLVEFDRPVGLFHLIGTEQYLERLLGVPRVDLVLRRAVIDELKDNILREAIDVFGTTEVEISPAAHAGSGG